MTAIQEQKITELCRTLKPDCILYGTIEGRYIRLEERKGSHILRSLLVHPTNQTESINTTMKDLAAICKDEGRTFTHWIEAVYPTKEET